MKFPLFLIEWFTERDNHTFCVVRALAFIGGVAMIYKFIASPAPDYQSFGIGLAGLGASIAAKNATEKQ